MPIKSCGQKNSAPRGKEGAGLNAHTELRAKRQRYTEIGLLPATSTTPDTHFEPKMLEFNGILRRGEQYLPSPTTRATRHGHGRVSSSQSVERVDQSLHVVRRDVRQKLADLIAPTLASGSVATANNHSHPVLRALALAPGAYTRSHFGSN
jgi:hypothetical protein